MPRRDLARDGEHVATLLEREVAVIDAPLRSRASTTTVAAHGPAMIRFRAGKRRLAQVAG